METLHRKLRSRAALAGMSSFDYLLGEFRQASQRDFGSEGLSTTIDRRPDFRQAAVFTAPSATD
jgi:hypothetical protein